MKKIYVISKSYQSNPNHKWNISDVKNAFTTWRRAEIYLTELIHRYEDGGFKILKDEVYTTEKGYQRDVALKSIQFGGEILYRISTLKVNDEL